MPSTEKSKPAYCLDCGENLQASDNFCKNCGQIANTPKPTLRHFLDDVLASLFSIDSKTFNSLKPILFKPGQITIEHFEGKRTRYISPVKFYLTVTVLFFLFTNLNTSLSKILVVDTASITNDFMAGFENGIKVNNQEKNELNEQESTLITPDSLLVISDTTNIKKQKKLKRKDKKKDKKKDDEKDDESKIPIDLTKKEGIGYAVVEGLQKKLKKSLEKDSIAITQEGVSYDSLMRAAPVLKRWMYLEKNKFIKESPSAFINYTISKLPLVLFCFLPFFAFILKFLLFRSGKYFLEHLVFIFHVQTFFFILLLLNELLSFWAIILQISNFNGLNNWVSLIFLIYLWKALNRFYPARTWVAIVRFMVVNTVYFITATFFAIGTAYALFLFY